MFSAPSSAPAMTASDLNTPFLEWSIKSFTAMLNCAESCLYVTFTLSSSMFCQRISGIGVDVVSSSADVGNTSQLFLPLIV